jgi:drug/metabolite transporter (DMT)-like permease
MGLRLHALCAGAVLSGTAAVLSMKSMYQTKTARGGEFNKPFTVALIIAAAMSMSLGCWIFTDRSSKRGNNSDELESSADEALLVPNEAEEKARFGRWDVLVLFLCGSSDVTCSICDTVSLNLAPASITSITSSSNIVFCAITTRMLLGTSYTARQYTGIVFGLGGLLCVAFASLLQDRDSAHAGGESHIALGVGITLFARLLQSFQVTLEEKFMKAGRFSPLEQVGWEGVVEVLLLAVVILPVVNCLLPGSDTNGRLEDVSEALVDIYQTKTLAILCALSFVSLALLNPLSMAIGLAHGSVLRVFMDVLRAAAVWIAEITMFRASGGKYGCGLNRWSWLQAIGFALIITGVVLFAAGSKRNPPDGSELGEGEKAAARRGSF